jgi:hypothetical protein
MYCPFCGDKGIIENQTIYMVPDEMPYSQRYKAGGVYYCKKCYNEFRLDYNPLKLVKIHE